MVDGKPQLTFGNSQILGPAKKRQASLGGAGRAGNTFASFLPAAEKAQSGQAGEGSAATTQALALRGTVTQGSMPARMAELAQDPPSGLRVGPAGNSSVAMAARRSGSTALGGQSFAEARKQGFGLTRSPLAQSAVSPSLLSSPGMSGEPSAGQRVSAKSSPRISGRPVTGRSAIGMVDTRRGAPGRSTLMAKGGLAYTAPLSSGLQVNGAEGTRFGGSIGAGNDPYTSFGASYRGPGLQSFVTHGFGGRHAQMALKNVGYDVNEVSPAQSRAQLLNDPGYMEGGNARGTGSVDQKSMRAKLSAGSYSAKSLVPAFYSMAEGELGSLAAKFESGSDGISAIGYDRKGGTSYGKYQISSRAGTMSNFIDYLREKAPDMARRLSTAGPANTGGRTGGMPAVWRQIASEEPERFEQLQSDFIRSSHFEPTVQALAEATGLTTTSMPAALREVLFSTAVQHGPNGAMRIVSQALESVGKDRLFQGEQGQIAKQAGEQFIKQIYSLRAGQFSSSTERVRASVRNRLRQEMNEALDMFS